MASHCEPAHGLQVTALEQRLAAEAKLREEAEQTLDRERRSAQMAGLASGSGEIGLSHLNLGAVFQRESATLCKAQEACRDSLPGS